ncbi:hypothetical protein QR680_010225 [Steinernema hermaphroditum]|uniref:G-protein coupled receptors family 1 profile domain-containing protein n=1 Tax=Steinernema hermaphroditum TaxID=289476 RepID=A0AA39IPW2_9BILA|nr:hypothetical protein QR680_010225 [Steinernema hermaphroditum]
MFIAALEVGALSLFAIFTSFNCLLIWAIVESRNLRRLWAYRIIGHLAISDLLFLVGTSVHTAYTFRENSTTAYLHVLAHRIYVVCVLTQSLLSLVLALNRFIIMIRIVKMDRDILYQIGIASSWIVGTIYFVCILHYENIFREVYHAFLYTVLGLLVLIYALITLSITVKVTLMLILYYCDSF